MSGQRSDAPPVGIAAIALLAAASGEAPVVMATVAEFDDDAGVGVLDVLGTGAVPFHCTAIADGTRSIGVGTSVVCRLVAAHHGRVEAAGIVSADPAGAAA